MADLSKYSDEDLERIAGQEQPGMLKSLGEGYLNYAKGAIKGTGQGLGDIGASVINAPISLAEHLSGSHIPHVPHPHLINEHPESRAENFGQKLGQLGAGLGVPGGAAVKSAQLANKGYKILRAGQELPLISKLLAGMAGSAGEGYLGNEENRPLGAGISALTGGLTQGISGIKALSSKNLAKGIQDVFSNLNKQYGNRFTGHLEAGEKAGANKFLRPEKVDINLMKQKGNKDFVYNLEKFNKDPSLINAHNAQSHMGRLERKYSNALKGTEERDIYDEALKTKNRLLQKISDSFEKAGVKEHGEGYQKTRTDFREAVAPYLNNPIIRGLLGRASPTGEQTIRPKRFAKLFLEDEKPAEKFLSKMGKSHPNLVTRERLHAASKNKPLMIGASLAAGAAGSYLPYEIRKLLEHH